MLRDEIIIPIGDMTWQEAFVITERVVKKHWPDVWFEQGNDNGIIDRFYYKIRNDSENIIHVLSVYGYPSISVFQIGHETIAKEMEKEIGLMLSVNEID